MPKPALFHIVNNLDVGGAQFLLAGLLPKLLPWYDVHVCTYRRQGALRETLGTKGIACHHLPVKGKWNPFAIGKMATLLRKHKTRVVHTHGLGGNITGMLASAAAGVPVRVAHVHTQAPHWYGKSAFRRFKRRWQEVLVHRAITQRVVLGSAELLEYYAQRTGLPRNMLVHVPSSVDLDRLTPDRDRQDVRRELGAGPDDTLVGFVGRLATGKGLSALLHFATQAIKDKPSVRFAVVGEGPLRAELHAKAQAAGIDESIIFAGKRMDAGNVYNALDALMFPSRPGWEASPLVPLEAACFGLPILATDTGPLRELRQRYPRILFLDQDASATRQLTDALALPKVDPEHARREFSADTMAAQIMRVYSSLDPDLPKA